MNKEQVINDFNKVWHESIDGTWHTTRWRGYKILKCPMDLFIYQEIIHKVKPGAIIETGTCFGGSALFLADMCEAVSCGRVLTIDIKPPRNPPKHNRLRYHLGSSIAASTITNVKGFLRKNPGPVLVILDSDHKAKHVAKELELYSQFVQPGSYIIVEDTNINRTVRLNHGPGPGAAVDEFLAKNNRFERDPSCERLYATFNPGGYLKCVR